VIVTPVERNITVRMSVLGIDQKLRRSFNKLKSYGTESEQEPAANESSDSGIFLQTFLHHWGSCQQTFLKYEPESSQVQDDVINVTAQLEQMIELLKYEATMCVSTSILDFILSENVLGQLVAWSKSLPSHIVGPVVNQELLVFEFLLLDKERGVRLLSHQTILRPLVNVLEMCESLQNSISEETLLGLVHSVSIVLMESPELIELFLSSSTSKNLVLFSLLTPYLHKPGILGQRAKESILIYVSMSSSQKIVENIIGESNFCLILATGLSALFSALPSNLEADHPSWHKLDISDCQVMPELNAIMSSFELCAAVVEVSPVSISNQLLSLIQSGFLTSILGPALTSDSESELVSYTAYLNFFLTEISTEALTSLFIRFLLTEEVDGKPIKDILVSRIILSSQVGVVTLALFETILSFNLEDVMFSLIFQHLISCTFLIPSYRDKIRYTDPQGRGTNKFLSLVPVSCDPPVTPVTPRRTPFSSPRSNPPPLSSTSSPRSLDPSSNLPLTNQNFDEYTREARQLIRTTVCDCIHWRNQYDGTDTYHHQQQQSANLRLGKQIGVRKGGAAGGAQLENDPLEDTAIEVIEGSAGPGSLSGESSGYLSGNWEQDIEEVQLSAEEEREFWSAVGGDKQRLHSVLARLQHEDRLSLSSLGQESHGSTEVSPRPSLPLQVSIIALTIKKTVHYYRA